MLQKEVKDITAEKNAWERAAMELQEDLDVARKRIGVMEKEWASASKEAARCSEKGSKHRDMPYQ